MLKKNTQKTKNTSLYFLILFILIVLGSICAYSFIAYHQSTNQSAIQTNNPADANDAYASIPGGDTLYAESDADILWNTEDPYYGYNKVPVVALVHINSIEGGRTYSPVSQQYVFPQTFGQMTVREVYKGALKPGEQLNYFRPGGTVTYDAYWKSLNKQQQEKVLSLNNGKRPDDKKYVHDSFSGDIDVEVDKDYLVLLIPQSSKDGRATEYLIDGLQYGLREAKGSGDELMVLNNTTKEWESIKSVVKQD